MFRPVGSEYDPHGGKRRARAGLRLSRQRLLLAVYEYTEALQVRRDHNSDTSYSTEANKRSYTRRTSTIRVVSAPDSKGET